MTKSTFPSHTHIVQHGCLRLHTFTIQFFIKIYAFCFFIINFAMTVDSYLYHPITKAMNTINIKIRGGKSERFSCPHCNSRLMIETKPEYMGKVISLTCPACKTKFQVRLIQDDPPKPNIPLEKDTYLIGRFGVYKILEVLGRGSFGITYLAEAQMEIKEYDGWKCEEMSTLPDETVVWQKVVIKEFFVKDSMLRNVDGTVDVDSRNMNQQYFNAFLNESSILRQIHNEHIVTVYDSFEAYNTAYYVMEYLEGGTLAQQWQGCHGLSDEMKAANIMLQIAYGVEYLHACGFVHLDIKPMNIMRRNDGTWVIIDFSIARSWCMSKEHSKDYLRCGSAFFAPVEQGSYFPVEEELPKMDIYALGATYYWLCNGMPPDAFLVLRQGLPKHDMARSGITPLTIHIIERAMRPYSGDRYPHVGQMIDDLRISQYSLGRLFDEPDVVLPIENEPLDNRKENTPYHPSYSKRYDNEYDGHTLRMMTVNSVVFSCETPADISMQEKVIGDMSPSPCGMMSEHPVGSFRGVIEAQSFMSRLQKGTSLRFQFPSDATLDRWAAQHPHYTSNNPVLCFKTTDATIYEASIVNGQVSYEKAILRGMWKEFDLLLELLIKMPPVFFMPSKWSFGFHPACKNGKWGMLRDDNRLVIECEYDNITPVAHLTLPGPGPLRCILGCRATKGDDLVFYELAPRQELKMMFRISQHYLKTHGPFT